MQMVQDESGRMVTVEERLKQKGIYTSEDDVRADIQSLKNQLEAKENILKAMQEKEKSEKKKKDEEGKGKSDNSKTKK